MQVDEGVSAGNIAWVDKYPASWSNWGPHEPNIRSGKNCAFVENFMKFPKEWGWKLDNNCQSPRSFVCKLTKFSSFVDPEDDHDHDHDDLGEPMGCEEGWKTHDGSWHCFKAIATQVTLAEATRQCEAEHSYLISIYSENGNHFAQRLYYNKN